MEADKLSASSLEKDEEIMNEAESINYRLAETKFMDLYCYFFKLTHLGAIISLSSMLQNILDGIGIMLTTRTGGVPMQAAFGLYALMQFFIVNTTTGGVAEKISQSCSKSAGMHNHYLTKRNFAQGLLIFFTMYFLIMLPIMLSGKYYLSAFGYSETMTTMTMHVLHLMVPSAFIRRCSDMYFSFIISQDIEKPFLPISIINFCISIVLVLIMCWHFNYGFYGWLLGRYFFDLFNFFTYIYVYFKKVHPKAVGLPPVKFLFDGFGSYFADCFKYIVSLFLEWSGYEIFQLLVASTLDPAQIATSSIFNNINNLIFNVGSGFGSVGRVRINYLLGFRRPDAAKNVFISFTLGTVTSGIIVGVLLFMVNPWLITLYAGNNPPVQYHLYGVILVMSLCSTLDQISTLTYTVARSLDLLRYSLALNFIFIIAIQIGVGSFIVKYKPDIMLLLINMYTTYLCVYLVLLIVYFVYDWTKVDLHPEITPKKKPGETDPLISRQRTLTKNDKLPEFLVRQDSKNVN